MNKFLLMTGCALVLAACQTTPTAPYYNQGNYDTASTGTRLNFEEAKEVCRSKTLEHHWMGDTKDLNVPNYTTCMDSYGYRFGKAQ